MDRVQYGPIRLEVVKTLNFAHQAIFEPNQKDYLYTNYQFDFICVFNPYATNYDAAAVPGGELPGRAVTGGFTLASIKSLLQKERQQLIVEVGGVLSVDWLAMTRLACSVCGWTPISPKRLTIACWTFGSAVFDE